ncbi:restriction endonuclease subunit S [Butyrivibrio hungatei]|uniref:Type I restriction-modification system S subunit HsdS n=1 Tax=Butyrivibrio hungatei TaxID=185008 RepID=A0A1D9P173_9FIRM|nr:restriction endonuclease subunit S [Butyrivibrio hungatei]AOZ96229.1 type I restriction-modification system S subunit HsdS [Butyrivibrio hungatei]
MKTTLGDIFEIGSGGTPSKAHPEYYGGEIPWVKTGDLKEEYLFSVEDCITEEGLKNSSAKMYEPGTVLIAMYGATIGATSILKLDACTNQACAAFKPSKDVKPEYLYYFLRSKKQKFISDGVGGAQPNISAGYLKKVQIDVRNLEEQDRIITILDGVNSVIQERQRELDLLDELIKARFVEMFGLPFGNEKWNVSELKDLSESMIDGSNVDPDYYESEGDVLFLRIQNVWRNEFRLDDSVYISHEINHEHYYDTSLHTGDLLITKIGRYYTKDSSLGRVSVYRGENDCANYSNNIMRVRLIDSMNSEFVNALLNLDDYQSFIKRTSKGGTDKRALSKSLIGGYPIIMPPKELQDEFVSFVKQVDKSKVVA